MYQTSAQMHVRMYCSEGRSCPVVERRDATPFTSVFLGQSVLSGIANKQDGSMATAHDHHLQLRYFNSSSRAAQTFHAGGHE